MFEAGAGKSTLMYVISSRVCSRLFTVPTRSAIIQDIEGMRAAGLATMAYYYFDFRDDKKQDCDGLLSSLISQFSVESDSCYNILSQLYLGHSRGTRKPTIGTLKKCMTNMLSLRGQGPIYIIIDGVDECPNFPGRPSAREKVLTVIKDLVGLNFRMFIYAWLSRPEMDIRLVLESLTSLKISLHDEIGQKEDIIAYIKFTVRSDRSMRRWREEDQDLVIATLSNGANGM